MVELTERFLENLEHATSHRREILARYQIDLLSATRKHRMVIQPAVILYMKVVLTIDAVTSELAPSLDVQSIIERFTAGGHGAAAWISHFIDDRS